MSSDEASEPSPVPSPHGQLRLALALRGGASMAVWTGGAVAEVDRLRRWTRPERDTDEGQRHPWAELAELAGYDSVEVDVLAGTSAGGLNATLLSASLVYGMPFGRMRRAWVRLADLEAMARPVPRPWQARPPSLLEGDGYFRRELAALLTEGITDGSAESPASRVELLLTATLLDPLTERRFDAAGVEFGQARRRAVFRFSHRGRPGDPLSDFGDPERPRNTARSLAQAARTTSSFPFAFEPAAFRSAPSAERGGGSDGGTAPPNMYGLFSETSTDHDGVFRAVDGGVLDNIPVTAALDTIERLEARGPTERRLLYLNPEPDPPEPSERTAGFARAVTATALRAKLGQESLLTDIEAIEEHNHRVRRSSGRRNSVFAELATTPRAERWQWLSARIQAVHTEHAEQFARMRAERVHTLLTSPEDVATPPLAAPLSGQAVEEWSATACGALRERLVRRHRQAAVHRPAESFDDVEALLAAVDECLRWVRCLQARCPSRVERFGPSKSGLYRLRMVVETLRGNLDRCWLHAAREEPVFTATDLDEWIERVRTRVHRLQHSLPAPVESELRPLLDGVLGTEEGVDALFQRQLSEFTEELASTVESSAEGVAGSGTDSLSEMWAVLDRIAARLLGVVEEADLRELDGVTRALLETASDGDTARLLRTVVVLGVPLGVSGDEGKQVLLHRVAGDRQSPLPFDSLRDPTGRIPVPDKVRGSGMGNFAAFLSAKWRANDWMWGRLDAVGGLVDLLVAPERLLRQADSLGATGVGDRLQAILSRPTGAELGELDESTARQWREFLARRWAERAGAVRAELDALFANPHEGHALSETRAAVTERLQWTVVAEELPFVEAVRSGADPFADEVPPTRDPGRLETAVRNYDVGRQRREDLAEDRMASVALRFTLVAHRALLPPWNGFRTALAALGATVAKPLILLVAFGMAAPRRAAVCVGSGAAAVALGDFGRSASGADGEGFWDWMRIYETSADPPGVLGVLAVPLALLAAVRWGWLRIPRASGRGARWLGGLTAGGLLLALGPWLLGSGVRLGPLGVLMVAVWITWYGGFALRRGGRVAATVLTTVVFGAVLATAVAAGWSPSDWLLWSALGTVVGQTLLLSTVDVLPARPRPEGTGRRAPSSEPTAGSERETTEDSRVPTG
ncbi:patatin-like protein [Actinopolyspora mortivallis]|uniref:patatin-like protein n=1 Tax=Actinopolyspora mortivallis TaxID=33906 RepID=UPI002158C09C|nr:patatin-like protein [Actinopolyspora mortivallis]